ncbi:uncharacterized protein [Dermacentor andersoni]|uniref:uncharacterized protein n=1 Tax=Dermacentor andersoni TaxID=34620 RepID=UPI002415FF12|nr:uncharacterized protein LOC129386124 [Dermacentor andersoni]
MAVSNMAGCSAALVQCTKIEDESSCGGVEEEGESLDVTADQAALVNTLSSSVLECAGEQTAADANTTALYRTLHALRVVPAPLKKPRLPLHRPPRASAFSEADGATALSQDRQVQLRPAAVGDAGGSRACLWLCAATSFLCFAALIAAVAAVILKSSDELNRSFGEVGRAFKDEIAAARRAVLVPSTTRDTVSSSRTTPISGSAFDASKSSLNRTDFTFKAD